MRLDEKQDSPFGPVLKMRCTTFQPYLTRKMENLYLTATYVLRVQPSEGRSDKKKNSLLPPAFPNVLPFSFGARYDVAWRQSWTITG
ncbi:hypothetical protein NPIL_89321 [Nephila pilipes]|uniref:Uncharacterized protein n=1 Tax=Nephila pilipes TaxID=299642 RepID=A0A8X6N195_NEPPI|nr:hypothetical protein NPIL_89321 [Nephila pilipes]